jgi:D-alanyl-D-alanine carboxypeptidase
MGNTKLLATWVVFILTSFFYIATACAVTSESISVGSEVAQKIILPEPTKKCDIDCVRHIQKLLDRYRETAGIPGVQLTINYLSQPMQTFCSGTTSKYGKTPINKNTRFEIASTTKSFTAAIALQLIKEGKFSLDDKLSKWFSTEYPAWNDNTVGQLLNMTSTILDYFDGDYGVFQDAYEKDPTHIWTTKELTDWVYQRGPYCTRSNPKSRYCAETPGAGWSYTNTNYILLERIIEKTTNETLQTFMYQRLFKPLHMINTIYDPELNPIYVEGLARGYCNDSTRPVYGKEVTNFSLSAGRSAGAIISTSEDLSKWVQGIFTGKVLLPQQMTQMTNSVCTTDNSYCLAGQPYPINKSVTSYSCGIMRLIQSSTKHVLWLHDGASEGFASIFGYDSQENLIVTVLQNLTPTTPSATMLLNQLIGYLVEQK